MNEKLSGSGKEEVAMELSELLAAAPGDYTEEMTDVLAQAHADLHEQHKAATEEGGRLTIRAQHAQVVRKWFALGRRHVMKDGLDEGMPEGLIEKSADTIPDMMDEYNELHRKGRSLGIFPALQEQYDALRGEMEQAGIVVGWLDELDGDKAEFYQQSRAVEQPIKDSVGKIEEGGTGKYSLQVAAKGNELTCAMKLGVGGKCVVYQLFVPKGLRQLFSIARYDDDDGAEIVKGAGEDILAALRDGKVFRGRYEATLGPKSELSASKKATGNEDDGYAVAIDSGKYKAAYSFDGEHSARYELRGGSLKGNDLVVRGVKMKGEDERVWMFNLAESEKTKTRDTVKKAVGDGDWVNAVITNHYEGKEDGEWYIEYAITTTTRVDQHGTKPTLQFLVDNINSFPVPLLFGHVVNLPDNTLGKVIDQKMLGDDMLWAKSRVSKAEPKAWEKIKDGTYDGVSMGFNEPEYEWDPDNPGCALITAGLIIEHSLTSLQSNEDARVGVVYETTRTRVREIRGHEAGQEQIRKEDCDMDADVQKALDEATSGIGEKLKAFAKRVYASVSQTRDAGGTKDTGDEQTAEQKTDATGTPEAEAATEAATEGRTAEAEAARVEAEAYKEPTAEESAKNDVEWAVKALVADKLEPMIRDIVGQAFATLLATVTAKIDEKLVAARTVAEATHVVEMKEIAGKLGELTTSTRETVAGLEKRVTEIAGTENPTRSVDAGETPPEQMSDLDRRRKLWQGSTPPQA